MVLQCLNFKRALKQLLLIPTYKKVNNKHTEHVIFFATMPFENKGKGQYNAPHFREFLHRQQNVYKIQQLYSSTS